MQIKPLSSSKINALALAIYLLVVATYIGFLTYCYVFAVSDLKASRTKTYRTWQNKENELWLARCAFFRYVSLNQSQLRDITDANSTEFIKAQQLLSKINPDLLMMLGATTGSYRDLMITTKVCSRGGACLQPLLLLREAPELQNIRIGLGPHPCQSEVGVGEYHCKDRCYSMDPSKIRYAVSRATDGVKVTLFSDDLLNQNEWSKGFSDFEPNFKPADSFLARVLGEYLKKHVSEISIKGTTDPGFTEAQACIPLDRFRDNVAAVGNFPAHAPLLSTNSYIFHSLESEAKSSRSVSGWFEDRCNWSYYLHSEHSQQYLKKSAKDGHS